MIVGSIPVLSPQAHRRIDQLAFPSLVATAALLSRRDPRAASIVLMTAAVEGTAHLITDYPPGILPWISFRTHNRWALTHGCLMTALSFALPGLSRQGRWVLRGLATVPIVLAVVSDTRRSSSRQGAMEFYPRHPTARPATLSSSGCAVSGG